MDWCDKVRVLLLRYIVLGCLITARHQISCDEGSHAPLVHHLQLYTSTHIVYWGTPLHAASANPVSVFGLK